MFETEAITINMIWATIVFIITLLVFIYEMFYGGKDGGEDD